MAVEKIQRLRIETLNKASIEAHSNLREDSGSAPGNLAQYPVVKDWVLSFYDHFITPRGNGGSGQGN